jgi:hypothetical protein
MVSRAAEALYVQAVLADLNIEAKVVLHTDSTAGKAIIQRSGVGKVRHLQVKYLAIQEWIRTKRLHVSKLSGTWNPSDILTKHVDKATLLRLRPLTGTRYGNEEPDQPQVIGMYRLHHSPTGASSSSLAWTCRVLLPTVVRKVRAQQEDNSSGAAFAGLLGLRAEVSLSGNWLDGGADVVSLFVLVCLFVLGLWVVSGVCGKGRARADMPQVRSGSPSAPDGTAAASTEASSAQAGPRDVLATARQRGHTRERRRPFWCRGHTRERLA